MNEDEKDDVRHEEEHKKEDLSTNHVDSTVIKIIKK
jgi:hypothetical protein